MRVVDPPNPAPPLIFHFSNIDPALLTDAAGPPLPFQPQNLPYGAPGYPRAREDDARAGMHLQSQADGVQGGDRPPAEMEPSMAVGGEKRGRDNAAASADEGVSAKRARRAGGTLIALTYSDMRTEELKALCRERKLCVSGRKAELVQ
ncbi:unnamed protein product [Somion occarium]|uniref:SAP domain-containing protein n=1 Tax=Somion occarium TaxID=3059160 RepID=A0ABP1DYX0_9APHY